MDPSHQDVADRHLLNRHVRYYGDDIAAVIAENEVAAMQGVRALKVEYEELPFVLDVQKAMEPDAPQIHENYSGNILKHTDIRKGDYAAAIQEPGLVKVEGWYETPTVQHCHIENHGCYAYEENGRVVVVSSTQIPHIIRRIVGQALGRPWADIEIIKPYIGGGFGNKADWRRSNVDILIQKIHETVRGLKPWVKFGVSPFGIYRNQSSDPLGSDTNGLQNYDDLYADVLLWARKGWIDYNIPQIYWQIGHPAADYETLVKWWAKHTENRPLFIGQSVMNTVQNADPKNSSINQLPRKMALQRAYQTIGGSCQWPASAVVENAGKYRDALVAEYHKYPALPPVFDFMDNEAPDKVRKVKPVWTADGYILFWTAPKFKDEMNRPVQYVVYRFGSKEKVDIDDPSRIVAVTRNTFYKLPYENGKTKYRYVVTALDRLHNESKSVGKKVKL